MKSRREAPAVAPRAASAVEPPESSAVALADAASGPLGEAPATLKDQSVWVVDANSLIFQVFHALPEMTSPRGEPVSAVFGFTRDMLYLLEEKKPTYLFVAFDAPERTFRHEMYDDYKAQRSEMPVDLVPQFEPIRRMLAGLGVPILELGGFEADDLLATIAHQVNELEGKCYLVTGDKDARQLITEHVKVYNVRKDQVYDACALEADWGIRPEQVVDFQALVGDSVDNVPGVPLVGPKIAGEYLRKYDTLDQLLEPRRGIAQGEAQGQPDRLPRAGTVEPRAGAARSTRADRDRLGGGPRQRRRPSGVSCAVCRAGISRADAEVFRAARARRRAALAGRLSNDRHARAAGLAGRRAEAAEADLDRYRNHEHEAPLGGDRRLFVRVEGRRGVLRAGARHRRDSGTSIRPRRSRRCGRSWKTPRSKSWGRI